MGNKMTREEELKGLESACSFLESMSDDERFEYLMKNSLSFKNEMEKTSTEFRNSTSSLIIQESSITVINKDSDRASISADIYKPGKSINNIEIRVVYSKESQTCQTAA